MININILKIASDTKFSGLKNVYTHKSKIKNRIPKVKRIVFII